MRKLLLEDLSKKLGVSKTLISMVLNGKGNHYGISKKTQATVLEAISKMNYSPNKHAKSLRTGKSYNIGLIVSDISNPFYSTIAKNIENVLFKGEYNLMVCSTDESEEKEKQLVDMMVSQQGVDGLIICSTLKDGSFYERPEFAKVPLVFIDRVLPMLPANYVLIDNSGGAEKIVDHLFASGCRRIACFAITPLYLSTISDRISGYRRGLVKNGLKKKDEILHTVHFDSIHEDVEKSLKDLQKMTPPVDAIFALNNNIAVAVLATLRKKGFEKLANVTVACFDDIETFNLVDKKVTSVSQPVEEIGKQSSQMLLDLIAGKQTTRENVVLGTKLVVR